MNPIEAAPRAPETHETEPSALESLEALSIDAGRHDLVVVAEDLCAQRLIQETFPPEKRAEAALEVREKSKEARDTLKRLRVAAALATTLLSLSPQESAAKEQGPVTAEMLAEHPERLEELLEGVLVSIAHEQANAPRPELAPLQEESSEVLRRIQDGRKESGRYGSLALKVGETAARALASAAGFGLGVAGYDIIKEIAKAVRARHA